MTPTPLLTLAEVADYLRLTPDHLARNLDAIRMRTGFPPPVQTRPYRWSPLAIRAWEIERAPRELQRHIPTLSGEDTKIEAATARLEATYGGHG